MKGANAPVGITGVSNVSNKNELKASLAQIGVGFAAIVSNKNELKENKLLLLSGGSSFGIKQE